MEARRVSCSSTWMLVFLSVSSAVETPSLRLHSTVFVVVPGSDLDLHCDLDLQGNLSTRVLTCSDPDHVQIYSCDIHETSTHQNVTLKLRNLTRSGEYRCHYHMTSVFWFLRVTSGSYKSHTKMDYTEIYVVGFITFLLLIFSVVGSVCVFRGHRKDCVTECCDFSRKRKQSREEGNRAVEEDNVDATTTPSTSFYASLETRPRSIYDVLDRSAAGREPQQAPEKPKNKPKVPVPPSSDGVFESVYENFQS